MEETVRMTMGEIKAAGGGRVDRAKLAATTEAVIRQHMAEDGEHSNTSLARYRLVPNVQTIRERLGMSQAGFARMIQVPVATVRNWEQHRTSIAPAARTLLRVLEREPDAVLRALAD